MTAPDLRGERGFTLVELLVATLAGIIVATATLAIVITSVHFSSNLGNRVDANQGGRVAMEKVVQALNSSCLAAAVPPIVAVGADGSTTDQNNAIFYSPPTAGSVNTSQMDGPTISPNEVKVSLVNNSLVMYTYPYLSGTAPSASNATPWTFSTTPSPAGGFVLLPHAAATTSGGVAQPVFQYFGYTAGGTIATTPYTVPLSAADAATTAEITISFQALPSNKGANSSAPGAGADLTNSVVFKLTPASSDPNGSNTPCT
jgi:hypothetical protein